MSELYLEWDTSKLERFSGRFRLDFIDRILELTAWALQGHLVIEAPSRTGAGRGTIESPKALGDLRYGIHIGADYLSFVHFGTGLYGPRRKLIFPRTARVLRFKIKGKVVYARFVKGQHPNPFADRAIDATEDDIPGIVQQVLREVAPL